MKDYTDEESRELYAMWRSLLSHEYTEHKWPEEALDRISNWVIWCVHQQGRRVADEA